MNASIADVLAGRARYAMAEADCLQLLPLLPDRCVAHVVTDPPYLLDFGNCVSAGRRDDFAVMRGALKVRTMKYAAFAPADVKAIGPDLARVADRWCLVWHDAESGHLWRKALGQKFVRTGAWVRTNPTPQFTGDRPGTGLELCTIVHAKPGRLRWRGGGSPAAWAHAQRHGTLGDDGNAHPTPKPLSLMLELVELFTDPDEIVLDPFAGSATTGVACLRLGRRFIGVEKDAAFAAVARDRLAAETQGLTLRDARRGQLPLFPAVAAAGAR